MIQNIVSLELYTRMPSMAQALIEQLTLKKPAYGWPALVYAADYDCPGIIISP